MFTIAIVYQSVDEWCRPYHYAYYGRVSEVCESSELIFCMKAQKVFALISFAGKSDLNSETCKH